MGSACGYCQSTKSVSIKSAQNESIIRQISAQILQPQIINIGHHKNQFSSSIQQQSQNSHIVNHDVNNEYLKSFQIGPYFLNPGYDPQCNLDLNQQQQIFRQIMHNNNNSIIEQMQQKEHQFLNNSFEKNLYLFKQKNPKQFYHFYLEGKLGQYRWAYWKACLFEQHIYNEHTYQTLIHQNETQKQIQESIDKDLFRTFPQLKFFTDSKDEQSDNGQQKLNNVLKAISIYFPEIGYTQGMNFIIAFMLLISGGQDEECFWMFNFLCRHKRFNLASIFMAEFPLLKFLMYILDYKIQKQHADLRKHLVQKLQIPEPLWISKWILTLFVISFKQETVVQFWDAIFATNIFMIIQIILSFMHIHQRQIMDCQDVQQFNEFILSFQKGKEDQKMIDAIIMQAHNIKISHGQIQKCAKNFNNKNKSNESLDIFTMYHNYSKVTEQQIINAKD